jgi:hypothetical protein
MLFAIAKVRRPDSCGERASGAKFAQAIALTAALPVDKLAHHPRRRVLSQMPEKIRPMPMA